MEGSSFAPDSRNGFRLLYRLEPYQSHQQNGIQSFRPDTLDPTTHAAATGRSLWRSHTLSNTTMEVRISTAASSSLVSLGEFVPHVSGMQRATRHCLFPNHKLAKTIKNGDIRIELLPVRLPNFCIRDSKGFKTTLLVLAPPS
jgi:hypothetical protein